MCDNLRRAREGDGRATPASASSEAHECRAALTIRRHHDDQDEHAEDSPQGPAEDGECPSVVVRLVSDGVVKSARSHDDLAFLVLARDVRVCEGIPLVESVRGGAYPRWLLDYGAKVLVHTQDRRDLSFVSASSVALESQLARLLARRRVLSSREEEGRDLSHRAQRARLREGRQDHQHYNPHLLVCENGGRL